MDKYNRVLEPVKKIDYNRFGHVLMDIIRQRDHIAKYVLKHHTQQVDA